MDTAIQKGIDVKWVFFFCGQKLDNGTFTVDLSIFPHPGQEKTWILIGKYSFGRIFSSSHTFSPFFQIFHLLFEFVRYYPSGDGIESLILPSSVMKQKHLCCLPYVCVCKGNRERRFRQERVCRGVLFFTDFNNSPSRHMDFI